MIAAPIVLGAFAARRAILPGTASRSILVSSVLVQSRW